MVLASSAALVQRARLTDIQLVALSAASQHEHGLILIPSRLQGAAGLAFGRKLISLGLAKERPVEPREIWWRRNSEDGVCFTLSITALGLAALGIDQNPGPGGNDDREYPAHPAINEAETSWEVASVQPITRPAAGSKRTKLLACLSAQDGSSVTEIAALLNWLPHTTRAALTGLRHAGYVIESWKPRSDNGAAEATRYRIAAPTTNEAAELPNDTTRQLAASAQTTADQGAV